MTTSLGVLINSKLNSRIPVLGSARWELAMFFSVIRKIIPTEVGPPKVPVQQPAQR